jgi:hypothetical protein
MVLCVMCFGELEFTKIYCTQHHNPTHTHKGQMTYCEGTQPPVGLRKILINQQIILFLTQLILNTSFLTLTRQHTYVIHMKHFLWSVGPLLMVAIIGQNMLKALVYY